MSDGALSGALYQAAFHDAAIGMAVVALEGRWLKVNPALCRLFGFASEEELASLDPERKLNADTFTPEDDVRQRLLEGALQSCQLEKSYQHRDGRTRWAQVKLSVAKGEPSVFIAQLEDISERRRTETEARSFFEQSLDLLAIADLNGHFTQLNPAWRAALGYEASELTERPFMEFIHAEDHERTNEALQALRRGDEVRAFRNRYLAKDGSYRWLDWNARLSDDGRLFCMARDVTSHIELEEKIRQASLIDELTGLYNRRGFFLLGEQVLRAAHRHERKQLVCYLDLDGLKEINDQLGHDQGDLALSDVAEVLKQVFRSSDITARLGGDEFVALAEGDRAAEASLRQRIGDALLRHNEEGGRPYFLAASFGIAYYNPRQPTALGELLLLADRQMYEHKRVSRSSRPQQDQ